MLRRKMDIKRIDNSIMIEEIPAMVAGANISETITEAKLRWLGYGRERLKKIMITWIGRRI